MRPPFKRLPTTTFDLHRRSQAEAQAALNALETALEEARKRGYASKFPTIDGVLVLAEPWVDRDILRAHLLGETPPAPGTEFAIAFVPGDGTLIEPTRWYVLPAVQAGTTALRIVVIALSAGHYDLLVREGWQGFFGRVLDELSDVGAIDES